MNDFNALQLAQNENTLDTLEANTHIVPRKIGVFDSGAGGLSVLKSLLSSKKFAHIIYYGDTARVPYGGKSPQTIQAYGLDALDFFAPFSLDLLIVACNTASAYALQAMQKAAKYPVLGVIEPGVLAVINKIADKNARILILGTKATVKSGLYAQMLATLGYTRTFSLATPLFVPLVEEGIFSGAVLEAAMELYFSALPAEFATPDAVILGCTHFPLLASAIAGYFANKPLLIHSGDAILQSLSQAYALEQQHAPTRLEFYASDALDSLRQTAELWLGVSQN